MKRRDVLKRAAALGVAGSFAGCVSQQDAPEGGGAGGDDEATDDSTTEQAVSVASREVVESGGTCGQENDASIAFEDGAVRVTGSIPASDPCHEAEMVDSTFDTQSGEMDLTMGVTETDADVCQQCLARVEYEAVVEFTGGSAGKVSVTHQGTDDDGPVATAENDG